MSKYCVITVQSHGTADGGAVAQRLALCCVRAKTGHNFPALGAALILGRNGSQLHVALEVWTMNLSHMIQLIWDSFIFFLFLRFDGLFCKMFFKRRVSWRMQTRTF